MSKKLPELLLFDDEADTGDLVVDRLAEDFNVTFCTTEHQIRDKLEPERFCVIVCDVNIQFSNKTGYQIIDEIRTDYHIREVPVVVYSGNRSIPEIKKSEGTYYDAYIQKDVEGWGSRLLTACIKACGKKRSMVSADVYERLFADVKGCNHLEDPLEPKYFKESEILDVHPDKNLTVRIVLDWLHQKDLDKLTEGVYVQALEEYHNYLLKR
jgi:CheY-like chemotaxis protein